MSRPTLDRARLVSRTLFPARERGALPAGWKLAAVRTVVDGPELDLELQHGVERVRITLAPGLEGPANLRSARFRLSTVGEAGEGAQALLKAVHWLVCRHEGRLSDDQWALIRGGYAVVGRTLFARLTLKCNERCVFCFADEEAAENTADLIRDLGHLRASLPAFPRLGVRELLVTGGEPTLVPELPGLMAGARAAGFSRITLETNARRFADPAFAERFAQAAPDRAFVSLYAVTPAVARAVGRVAAPLEERLLGMEALLALGCEVEVNLVLARPNLVRRRPWWRRWRSASRAGCGP
jgi:hypothetical protein